VSMVIFQGSSVKNFKKLLWPIDKAPTVKAEF
jgi:hypothetical protein